jgi:hypothetical protein
MSPEQFGERRHEKCRYGRLTEAYVGDVGGGPMKPEAAPLCGYMPDEPLPPILRRSWGGGLVDFATDCALCERYTELP